MTAPAPDLLIVIVLVALNTGLSVALPKTKPLIGAVSDVPESRVNTTGPDMAVTAFKSVNAADKDT